ncbi:unnamed protein product [Ambrosiozyma monospora]|uniref:Unnamed protein product n=1 Tax=Ambrosiozyma monospora TaxID=43982 RepID=A0ACB5TV19_AMBMO|nr:unnamed protein product [Ambrosiozyma monospora]
MAFSSNTMSITLPGEREIQLPLYEADEDSNDYTTPSSRQVLRIAINLKHLIDKLIPISIELDDITSQDSIIINDQVIKAVKLAAGGSGEGKGSSAMRYQAALVFCLLQVSDWYYQLMLNELSDTELYRARKTAAETIASNLLESEEDDKYLFLSMLCHRYSINLNDEDSDPANVMELAVDMHCTAVISSSG